jgi:hypothetical protein
MSIVVFVGAVVVGALVDVNPARRRDEIGDH